MACLMADEGHDVEGGYLRWFASQRLESTTAIGCLVLVRMLQAGHRERLPSFEAVHAAQARPSILSGFLCRLVYGDVCGAPANYVRHSESAPEGGRYRSSLRSTSRTSSHRFTLGMLSTSSEPAVASSYGSGRSSGRN